MKKDELLKTIAKQPSKPTNALKVDDLRKIAKEKGIKTDELLKTIDEQSETVDNTKIIFKNIKTGEEHRFPSIYKAAKEMNISTSQVTYNVGKTKTIKGIEYLITKI